MTPEDRIKLAEAMYENDTHSLVIGKTGELIWLTDEDGKVIVETLMPLPDPSTDANDDYAVLRHFETVGRKSPDKWEAFKDYWREVRGEWNVWNYEIGDYARAALKVLNNDT